MTLRPTARRLLLLALPIGLLLGSAGLVAGSPIGGCAAPPSAWARTTVSAAAAAIWPRLLDQSPYAGGESEFAGVIELYDRNGDGVICVKAMWGDALNPNSHWYRVGIEVLGSPTQQFFVADNRARAKS